MLTAQTWADLDRQRFPAEDIDDGQRPELLAVAEFIVDEVE